MKIPTLSRRPRRPIFIGLLEGIRLAVLLCVTTKESSGPPPFVSEAADWLWRPLPSSALSASHDACYAHCISIAGLGHARLVDTSARVGNYPISTVNAGSNNAFSISPFLT